MDKSVMFAVAGSGKTTLLINRLSLGKRALIITYTENNHAHLRNCIIKKFGYIPKNITLLSYFSFLHGFCYRPLLQLQLETRGLSFRPPPERTMKLSRKDLGYYRNSKGSLYHNRLAKLLEVSDAIPEVIARIERFYDEFYVDEVQDFAGHDFNLLIALANAQVDILFVGDFYQHTFDTSRDGPVNRTLHDNIDEYEKRFRKAGFKVDKQTLSRSWRCGTTVCAFIRTHLQIDMHSHEQRETEIIPIDTQVEANAIHADPNIVKLFYQEHHKYGCYSHNWGASKGLDHFNDVCVVMGPQHWKQYQLGTLGTISSRNKLYVALSRTRGNLYLMPDKLFKAFKSS